MLLLYIDPGTGSMLLSLFIGIATAGVFGLRALFIKLQFIFSGGKIEKKEADNNIPFVIFSDHKRYWNVFKPICDEFEKRKQNLVYYTCSPDDPALEEEYGYIKAEYIGKGNKAFAKLNYLHADILIATTPNLEVYQWKRSKNVKCYVHIPHYVGDLSDYRMFGLDFYDVVLTNGKNQEDFIKKIEGLRPKIKRKEICNTGSIVLDNLRTKLIEKGKNKENKETIVLVAPSWGKSGILSRFGEDLLSALIKTDFKIVVRPHPQTVVSEQKILKPLIEKFSGIEWNYDNDNFDILNRADILISDFSGVIFDFSMVFDKPVIYADTNFDTLPYDADWLDEPMWSLRVLPEIGIELRQQDFDSIESVIKAALDSRSLRDGRNNVRRQCWDNIGDSVILTTDWLIEKQIQFNRLEENNVLHK